MPPKIKNFLSKIFKKKRHPSDKPMWPKVDRDWKVLLISFCVLLLAIVLLSAVLYINVSAGNIFLVQKPSSDTALSLDRDLLQKTLDFYDNRARNFKEIEMNPKTLRDPAL